MENEFELDEEYPEMSDAQARDVYNDIAIYLDGYIYPWIRQGSICSPSFFYSFAPDKFF